MMTNMYATKIFTEIYKNYDTFKTEYRASSLNLTELKDANLEVIYYLLYAKYGNSPIANYCEKQFKIKLFGIIWQYAPAWQKRLDIQTQIRALGSNPNDLSDILTGSKAIYNHAFNPGEIKSERASSTTNQPELQYVNDQNVTNYTKSKMDAYMQLWDLLDTDVTSEFINRFKGLFKQFVRPGALLFEDEDGD